MAGRGVGGDDVRGRTVRRVFEHGGAHADGAAGQAKAAAGAFEAARAAIVHPAVVSANRTQLVSLVTSNLFGQNAPAIAATEAHYEQMWAQDVAAMAGYHADASAAATQLGPGLQALNRGATRLAGLLGLKPGRHARAEQSGPDEPNTQCRKTVDHVLRRS